MIDAEKAEAMLLELLHLPEIADWGGVTIPRKFGTAFLQEHGVIPESVKDMLEQGMSPQAIKDRIIGDGFFRPLQGGVG